MRTFGKKIADGIALAIVLLLVIGGVAFRGITSLTETSLWVAHTHEVIERTTAALAAIKDMETAARGFVITGDDAFHETYRAGRQVLPGILESLRFLLFVFLVCLL